MIETLLEEVGEYGKTSYELARLKAIDKTSDVISSLLAHSVVLIIFLSFMLFLSLGFAVWLGQILGKIYYGFFLIAGFYGITGFLVHFFMRKWIKRLAGDTFIKQVLK
jgi:ABC-type uncharacterized transport system fused permease/ATPase subunit